MSEAASVLQQTNFTRLDWAIVIVYPVISLGIGLYVRKFIRNMNDFVVAGRGLGVPDSSCPISRVKSSEPRELAGGDAIARVLPPSQGGS